MSLRSIRSGAPEVSEHGLSSDALDLLFFQARSPRGWLDRPVSDELIARIYQAARMGPTSMNCSPARFVFVRTDAGKERLREALSPGNVEKAMAAPLVAIVGSDYEFPRWLPMLLPHRDVQHMFASSPSLVRDTARRNATLQGAYLIIAARAFGLDCGPLSGFDASRIERLFFAGTAIRADFLCCLGHGDPAKLTPRLPRLEFDDACRWE